MRRREYENLFVRRRRQQSLRDTVHRVVVAFSLVVVIGVCIWVILRLGGLPP